jgi:hypothetical protein
LSNHDSFVCGFFSERKIMKYLAPLLTSIISLSALPMMADPIFTLSPVGGIVVGGAGDTVGWGFTIQNGTDYLVVDEFDFDAITSLGTFTDFSGYNFIVVGPTPESTSVSQAFNSTLFSGVGSFVVNGAATVGQSAAGYINLHYDLFSVDPNDPSFDPDTDTLATDQIISAFAEVEVPETPSLLSLPLGVGLVLLGDYWLRRRRVVAA